MAYYRYYTDIDWGVARITTSASTAARSASTAGADIIFSLF